MAGPAAPVAMAVDPSPAKQKKERKRKQAVKEGKQKEIIAENAPEEQLAEQLDGQVQVAQQKTWPFVRLSEPQGSSNANTLAPLLSKDGRFCFIASGRLIKIYSVSTSQLVSTLVSSTSSLRGDQVTGLFLNPTNALQLIVTGLDGHIRIWDFLDAKILRDIDMGNPVILAAMSDAPALQDQLFVAVKSAEQDPVPSSTASGKAKKESNSAPSGSIIYQVALRRTDNKRIRIGKCRAPQSMAISADGSYLILLSKRKVYISMLSQDLKNPTAAIAGKDSFISFEGFPERFQERFTTLACHPTESYFATGDTKGSICLWYVLDPTLLNSLSTGATHINGDFMRKHTSAMHWHAHGVASLAFTPNGAYLLSGGEEAVLVVWQLSSRHKEYVPRLGAPIQSVGVVQNQGREQEFVCRLNDGSTVFVGAATLKVVRSIAGVKSIPAPTTPFGKSRISSYPLAVEPNTQHLVFLASHPSAIQFFSPSLNGHVYELEVSPTNRVSRTDERAIEPTRVEKVCFSTPASQNNSTLGGGDSRTWMATSDTWQDRDYRRENHLKFWLRSSDGQGGAGYMLNTRIDNPHGEAPISSMAFTPSENGLPLLATASSASGEGQTIKLWRHTTFDAHIAASLPNGAWQCVSSFNYRNLGVKDLAFSSDGSLLAVAHTVNSSSGTGATLTLWDASNGTMIKSMSAGSRVGSKVKKVSFVEGKEGTSLVLAGNAGSVVWDVLTCEELLSLPLPSSNLLGSSSSAPSYITSFNSTLHEIDLGASTLNTHELSFDVQAITPYTSSFSSSSSAAAYAAVSRKGDVILTAPNEGALSVFGSASAATGGVSLRSIDASTLGGGNKPLRLFDELFGTAGADQAGQQAVVSTPAYVRQSGKKEDVFMRTQSHNLPSVQSMWKELLTPGLKPLVGGNSSRNKGDNLDEEVEADEEEDKDEAMDVDDSDKLSAPPRAGLQDYTDSPSTLSDIFSSLFSSSTASLNTNENNEAVATPVKTVSQSEKEKRSTAKKENRESGLSRLANLSGGGGSGKKTSGGSGKGGRMSIG